jgi:hypothetical protein
MLEYIIFLENLPVLGSEGFMKWRKRAERHLVIALTYPYNKDIKAIRNPLKNKRMMK